MIEATAFSTRTRQCRVLALLLLIAFSLFSLSFPFHSAAYAQANSPIYATIGPEAAPILRALAPTAQQVAVEPGTLAVAVQKYSFAAIFASREWMSQADLKAASAIPTLRIVWLEREITVEAMEVNILTVADALDVKSAGERWVADLKAGLERIHQDVRNATATRVLVLTPEGYTAGQGALITELIGLAGGINVAAEAGIPEARDLDDTQIRQFAPDVVLLVDWTVQSASISALAHNPAYKGIPAFDGYRIYPFSLPDNDPSQLLRTVQRLIDLIHPQIF